MTTKATFAVYMLTGRTDPYAMKEGYVARGKKNPNNVRRGDREQAILFASQNEADAFIDRFAAKGAWSRGTSFEAGRVNVYVVEAWWIREVA